MILELSDAETVVLHDLLYRMSGKEEYFEDIAEQYVLWSIECQLEKKIAPVDNCTKRIEQARDTVRKNY